MDPGLVQWLSGVSGVVFRVAAAGFVALNVAAALVVVAKRDRRLVQRWTSPWLAGNLILIGAGIGVPMLAGMAKFAVWTFTALTAGTTVAVE